MLTLNLKMYKNDDAEPFWSDIVAVVPRVGETVSVGDFSLPVLAVEHLLRPNEAMNEQTVRIYFEEPEFKIRKLLERFASAQIGAKMEDVEAEFHRQFDREIDGLGMCRAQFTGGPDGSCKMQVLSPIAGAYVCTIACGNEMSIVEEPEL